MALERYGLGAIITADSKAFVDETGRARNSLGQFISTANQVPSAVSRMSIAITRASRTMAAGAAQIASGAQMLSSGLRSAALGSLPLTIAIGAGIIKAAQFEKQMSAVGAVTRADEDDMSALTKEAKRMGIVSVYTATQAGESMEQLARAGANTNQIIASLQGTMNAAAADSIELSTAADIVAQTVKSMDLAWSDAAHVADVLALTSASANTNITLLGESFKYGASMAKGLDISLEQTAAIFGKLGDAGLKGSIAGTSFVNMMNKLVKPSEVAEAKMKKWGISLEDSNKKLRPISSIVNDIAVKMGEIPSAAERARLGVEFFGLRGVKAYNALRIQGKEAIDDLENSLIASSFGVGAATEAAEKRLDNFLGRVTLFGASIESLSIGLFGPMLKSFTPVVEEMTKGLNSVLFSLDALNDIRAEESKQNSKSSQLIAKNVSQRLQESGAMQNYAKSTRSAIQVLSRMQMSEENLSRAQIEARKRGVLAAFEAESRRRAEIIKTAHLATAKANSEEQLSNSRRKMMLNQIKSMTEARKAEVQSQIDIAFSGSKGSLEAQKWLRQRVLQEALDSNKNMSDAEKEAAIKSIDNLIAINSERAKNADSIRAEIFSVEKLQEIEEKHGNSVVQIALGMQDAVDGIIKSWEGLIAKVKEFGRKIDSTLGKDGIRKLSKYATYIVIIGAAVITVSLAISILSFAIGGLIKAFNGLRIIALGAINIIKGALIALYGAFWPILIVVGALAIAFSLYRKEGESFGETFTRLWGDIKNAANEFYNRILEITEGFLSRWNELSEGVKEKWNNLWDRVLGVVDDAVAKIKEKFGGIFGNFFQDSENVATDWKNIGGSIADAIAWASDFAIENINRVLDFISYAIDIVTSVIEGPLELLSSMIDAIGYYSDYLYAIFSSTWETIKETFSSVIDEIKTLISSIVGPSENASESWSRAGRLIGYVIVEVLHIIATTVGWVVKIVGTVIKYAIRLITTVVTGVKKVFGEVFGGILQILEGDFLGGLKRIGITLFNVITMPIRLALSEILKLVKAIPKAESGLKYLGVDLNSIQKWLDEGISYGEDNKTKKRNKALASAQIAMEAKSKEPEVKVDVSGKSGSFESRITDLKNRLEQINDLKTQQKRRATETPKTDVNVNLEDKRVLDVKNQMCVDGESLNVASARHRQEIHDRAGYKSTPWQRRTMLEQGVAPIRKASG